MAKGSGGSGVSIGGRSVGARSTRAVENALRNGREVTYRSSNGKTYRATVENRGGFAHLTIRGAGNRRLQSRRINESGRGGALTYAEAALSFLAG